MGNGGIAKDPPIHTYTQINPKPTLRTLDLTMTPVRHHLVWQCQQTGRSVRRLMVLLFFSCVGNVVDGSFVHTLRARIQNRINTRTNILPGPRRAHVAVVGGGRHVHVHQRLLRVLEDAALPIVYVNVCVIKAIRGCDVRFVIYSNPTQSACSTQAKDAHRMRETSAPSWMGSTQSNHTSLLFVLVC